MAQAASHAFIFGDDFGLERRDGTVRRAQDRAAVEEAEQRGYGEGFAAGQAAQQASDEAQLLAVMQSLAVSLDQLQREKDAFLLQCEEQSVALAATLSALYGQIVDGLDPHAAFTAASRDVFSRFGHAARIVARVPMAMRGEVDAKLHFLADELRFTGTLSVEALPAHAGDTRFDLEWPEGALSFDRAELQTRLQAEFARFGFSMTEVNDHE
jgi:flagellar assembly protein FliH